MLYFHRAATRLNLESALCDITKVRSLSKKKKVKVLLYLSISWKYIFRKHQGKPQDKLGLYRGFSSPFPHRLSTTKEINSARVPMNPLHGFPSRTGSSLPEVLQKRRPTAHISAQERTGNGKSDFTQSCENTSRRTRRGGRSRAGLPVENRSGPGRGAKEAPHLPGNHSALVFHNTPAL